MKKKWWHDKVAYQIYPKSFYDSNGDGIGDIPGIISKLDYLKDLGVDIIWLSPCFCSPLADQGYDISDYYNIDPRFGTIEDIDVLLEEAKKRDMYILMDLVVNHCSDEHEWFEKACEDPMGEYGKFFYIQNGKEDGSEPNNWRSYFGGSAWDKLPGHEEENLYYLHLFHKKQPDLNWEHKEMREEVYKMINWWLDKGLAGFRIDAIINIKKALPVENYSYPADRDDGLVRPQRMLKDAVGIGEFLGEMHERTFKPHDSFAVGEVFDVEKKDLPEFIGDDGYFSSMFDFNETIFGSSDKGWYDAKKITPDDYKRCCFESQAEMDGVGYFSNIIENHDEPRGVSRYIPEGECTPRAKKLLGAMNFLLKGLPFIYQGQEIGMENVVLESIDQVDDISTLDEYQVAKNAGLSDEEALKVVNFFSRDNARTPMQWTDKAQAGFTTGTPWLYVNPNYTEINVAAQEEDPESVLNWYKALISLRKNPEYKETVVYGDTVPVLEDTHNLMAYYRKGENQTILVIGNYQPQAQTVELPCEIEKVLLDNTKGVQNEYSELPAFKDGKLTLEGYQTIAAVVKEA
ncbi:MAG: alpha-glucosidase [Lachnospiraceae bacterium]|nr:alpha-glucosidase [Lachnospiraceae bacterium]